MHAGDAYKKRSGEYKPKTHTKLVGCDADIACEKDLRWPLYQTIWQLWFIQIEIQIYCFKFTKQGIQRNKLP